MTNGQYPMTKECSVSNDQIVEVEGIGYWQSHGHSSLRIGHWKFFGYCSLVIGHCLTLAPNLLAEAFHLPTANRALFDHGPAEKFFVGTTGIPWTSGTFGCVRTEGCQMNEVVFLLCD